MGRASMLRHDGRRAALAFLIVSLLMTLVTPLHAQDAGAAKARALNLVALGDSLTAGYGLPAAAAAFPVQLEAALKARGHAVTVANAASPATPRPAGSTGSTGRCRTGPTG